MDITGVEEGVPMGMFATYRYDGHRWSPHHPDDPPLAGPWLTVDIHDSDFTTVVYRPAATGSGTAYLGFTPRSYFEDDEASPATDTAREASGLAAWWAARRGGATDAERHAKEAELRAYLAEDLSLLDTDVDDWASGEDDEDFDEAELFVEIKTARFLAALELPLPDVLTAVGQVG